MRRRKEMAALLARRERDGLSLRELSEETGIPFGTLSWWSWRLRQGSSGESSDGGFVEVVAAGRSAREAVVVRSSNGVEIEVPLGTDVAWLGSHTDFALSVEVVNALAQAGQIDARSR